LERLLLQADAMLAAAQFARARIRSNSPNRIHPSPERTSRSVYSIRTLYHGDLRS
jgi:hypothetical protein